MSSWHLSTCANLLTCRLIIMGPSIASDKGLSSTKNGWYFSYPVFFNENICCGYSLEVPLHFSYFSMKTYVVTEAFLMRTYIICFHGEIKIFSWYPLSSRAIGMHYSHYMPYDIISIFTWTSSFISVGILCTCWIFILQVKNHIKEKMGPVCQKNNFVTYLI